MFISILVVNIADLTLNMTFGGLWFEQLLNSCPRDLSDWRVVFWIVWFIVYEVFFLGYLVLFTKLIRLLLVFPIVDWFRLVFYMRLLNSFVFPLRMNLWSGDPDWPRYYQVKYYFALLVRSSCFTICDRLINHIDQLGVSREQIWCLTMSVIDRSAKYVMTNMIN